MSNSLAFLFELGPAEKLQLVQDLWDDLAAKPSDVPIPQWQIDELDRREQALKDHPESMIEWEEVKRRIRSRYGR
jgi:putative addiction module component (TIGR02574 family)